MFTYQTVEDIKFAKENVTPDDVAEWEESYYNCDDYLDWWHDFSLFADALGMPSDRDAYHASDFYKDALYDYIRMMKE